MKSHKKRKLPRYRIDPQMQKCFASSFSRGILRSRQETCSLMNVNAFGFCISSERELAKTGEYLKVMLDPSKSYGLNVRGKVQWTGILRTNNSAGSSISYMYGAKCIDLSDLDMRDLFRFTKKWKVGVS